MQSTEAKIERALKSLWRFLAQHWNLVVTAVATIGYLASTLFPKHGNPAFYADLGIAAILLTLIEIKTLLQKDLRPPSTFENLREAAPTILSAIRGQMTGGHSGVLQIQIFGSRLLTAANMLRGILSEVASRSLRAHDVKFTVYCLDPEFVVRCDTPTAQGEGRASAARYSALIDRAIEDLEAFNSMPACKADNVTVEFITYRTFPFVYAFLIGDKHLYVGPYMWDEALGDFEGAGNLCYEVRGGHPLFRQFKEYLENRGAFYRGCSERIRSGER
jgi:hypothetical protein